MVVMDDVVQLPLQDERARWLIPWKRYRFPLDWAAQFGQAEGTLPLHLEIGFGDGRYTVWRAREEPSACFVGLEISGVSVQRALRKLKTEGLSNVRLLKVGAQFAVRHLFGPQALRSITVNFPDPWPKERHEKHRLLKRTFFDLAASRLVPGGRILLATDHPEYHAFARAEAKRSGFYALEAADPPAAVLETKYALKWKAQGKPLYYQVFTYQGGEPPHYPILERDELMPHALLRGQLPSEISFAKQVVPYASGYVILHDVARVIGSEKEEGERWLVRATVDEADIKQQVLISVKHRGGEELIVQIEPFGDPVITKVTRGAVHAVTEWLLTLPADLRVLRRSY